MNTRTWGNRIASPVETALFYGSNAKTQRQLLSGQSKEAQQCSNHSTSIRTPITESFGCRTVMGTL